VLDVRESFRNSCVLGFEEKGRSGVTVVMNSCFRGLIEFGRVLRVAVNSCVLESKQVGRVLAGWV
jgi:hypothetical protein